MHSWILTLFILLVITCYLLPISRVMLNVMRFFASKVGAFWADEKAVQDKDLATKMPMWEIPTADYPKMKSILMMMEKIKDV